jgi:hypothetical protein
MNKLFDSSPVIEIALFDAVERILAKTSTVIARSTCDAAIISFFSCNGKIASIEAVERILAKT